MSHFYIGMSRLVFSTKRHIWHDSQVSGEIKKEEARVGSRNLQCASWLCGNEGSQEHVSTNLRLCLRLFQHISYGVHPDTHCSNFLTFWINLVLSFPIWCAPGILDFNPHSDTPLVMVLRLMVVTFISI